jgi:hypothetical protein
VTRMRDLCAGSVIDVVRDRALARSSAVRALQGLPSRRRRVAFKSIAVPWLGGGLIVVGYAAFNWLRDKRLQRERADADRLARESPKPLAANLEHVPDELALDLETETLPANSNASARAELGALFLGRATSALAPIHFGPEWPDNRR